AGVDVGRQLRAQPRLRTTPLVFLVPPGPGERSLRDAYTLGAVAHLVQPVPPAVLRTKVGLFVDHHRQTRHRGEEHAATQLRACEARLRLATDAAGMGLWVWHIADDHVTWENDRLHEIFGVAPTDEPINAARFKADFLHPDDAGSFEHALALTVETGADFRFLGRFRRGDGEGRWVELTGLLQRHDDGTPATILGAAVDVTARRRTEEALLEQDRRKDEFLAILAHELRNPLAPIRTGLELLKQVPSTDPASTSARAIMERQLGHMVRLIDDLLDVSRISQGRVELKRARVQMRAVLDHAVEASRPSIEAASHALALSVPDEPLWLEGDLTRLAQVVSNLLNNSARYTPAGGHIELTASASGHEAVLTVSDNGSGITADMLPRVFDLFTQGTRTLHRAQGGLGIGLTLVRKLLELHGGTITAQSPGLGQGSTFTVRLPLAITEVVAPPPPAPSSSVPPDSVSLRILVVDDNVDGAEMLAMVLARRGHQTRSVYEGEGALVAVREFLPEVIFLDLGLPEMDGYEVARQLRADPDVSQPLLVALTG
ncbi:MAG: response regulator, partial [Myxococcales bacterium]